MQLLLLKDVRKLGHIGDVVEVKTGYARNCLIPQLLATLPTEENIAAIEEDKKRAAGQRAKRLKEFESLAEQVTDVTITIEATANPEGTLYGSVGAVEIAEALQALGHAVLPEQVALGAPIRSLDNLSITLEFTEEVSAQVKLWVVRAGASEDDAGGEPEPDDDDDGESRFEEYDDD